MTSKLRRILAVTAGLVFAGAAVGAALGALVLGGFLLIVDRQLPLSQLLGVGMIGAMYGAAIGVVLAPIASWTLLRRVPLGLAIAETAIGTLLGAVLGFPIYMIGPVVGGIIGFSAAAIHLRVVIAPRIARARAREVTAGGDPFGEE
jgi:hypothetical protein